VAEYLGRSRVPRPELHGPGITLGGSDEAWLYRDEMRATWKITRGALNWLKQTFKNRSRRNGAYLSKN
jgi:hypothetical protein